MLRDIKIKAVYDSEHDNILEDFYIPVLAHSVSYDRAVGYFDAKMLISSARGMASFIDNDGQMRLICGATLKEKEYQAIAKGYEYREIKERIEKNFLEIIESDSSDLFKNQINALTWMIRNNRLDVKIALRRDGIHHQKTGIFTDDNGDFIVFQGSANETLNALTPANYEVINVFKSWNAEFKDHYEPHVRNFQQLWGNDAKNTLVLDISDISERILSQASPSVFRPKIKDEIDLWQQRLNDHPAIFPNKNVPIVPAKIGEHDFSLRRHQREALNSWKENRFQGLFELATGAGKTITAIYGAVKMFESRKKLLVVISVPYQNLADQWAENLELFNITPVVCYGGEGKWLEHLKSKMLSFNAGTIDFCAVVVVDATFTSSKRTFSDILETLPSELNNRFLFIGDECHHHGAEKIANALPQNADLRIGLSATPDRGKEDEGNDRITDYYGGIVSQYTLEDALKDQVLTPYEYHLIPVELTVEETERYVDLSKQISKQFAIVKSSKGNPAHIDKLNILLSKRAKVVNGCENKPIALRSLLKSIEPINHSLFYCAEGKLDDGSEQDDQDGLKQIENISSILHEYGWKSSQFTANEKKPQREQILADFKNESIHSLVAMKCLDEGVDIPACSTAFILASSRKPRQFVQRRGRILRKSKGKTRAVIYDFFVTLPLEFSDDDKIGRRLLKAELERIKEFANLSLNKGEAYKTLGDYLKKLDLYHWI
nr:DEAD/DEAH box helicase family protein [uncultured Cohaesibacter sp.]